MPLAAFPNPSSAAAAARSCRCRCHASRKSTSMYASRCATSWKVGLQGIGANVSRLHHVCHALRLRQCQGCARQSPAAMYGWLTARPPTQPDKRHLPK